ncbi:hypothetical protein L3Q82_025669, partial [Scortum barcoo]
MEEEESSDIEGSHQSSGRKTESGVTNVPKASPKTPQPKTPEKTSSGGSSDKDTVSVVQEIIRKEASQIVEPLLDDLSDDEFELLQSKSSVETEVVAEEIAQIVE